MSDQIDNVWQEYVKDVRKLDKPKRENVFRKSLRLTVIPKISADKVYRGRPLEQLQTGADANIDANTARRFKRGDFVREAELDLHGYTEDRAYDAVIDFIKKAYLQKKRCIAIITGKGLHQNNEDDIFANRGILKNRVPQWLNLPEIRPLILAINHPEHRRGGSGVIEILLRRQRS